MATQASREASRGKSKGFAWKRSARARALDFGEYGGRGTKISRPSLHDSKNHAE
jgi:hypothetical protein